MFNNQYEIKYMVDFQRISYNNFSELDIEIISVYKLLEYTENEIRKTLTIEPNKWKNIALISVFKDNKHELIKYGAKEIESKFLYSTKNDAKIQLAFVCSKYMVKPSDVNIVTNGLLNERVYKNLLKYFYEEFPEKYI